MWTNIYNHHLYENPDSKITHLHENPDSKITHLHMHDSLNSEYGQNLLVFSVTRLVLGTFSNFAAERVASTSSRLRLTFDY